MGGLKEMLKDWAYEKRLVVSKKDVAAYASSDATRYFWIDKLEGQRILIPKRTPSRVKLWEINWDAVPKWYPDLAPVVEDILQNETDAARKEARELLQKMKEAKPLKAEASA